MNRPEYLKNYIFDWDVFDVVVGGRSALDSNFFVAKLDDITEVNKFLKGYGLDPDNPVARAELFGNFQEAIQFIKRYFLRDGSPDGLDLEIPTSLFTVTDISGLFLMATGNSDHSVEEQLWAEIALKVMHTILHADKDLRSNYFNQIQTQIFDKFYRFLHRDNDNNLFLKSGDISIPLVDFETKSKKSRDSVIIKLLHKAENVAEELFDRVGVRLVTKNKLDILKVLQFMIRNYVITPHNIKPSRSLNTIFDISLFRTKYSNLVKMALRNNLSEERFVSAVNREIDECSFENTESDHNLHSSAKYRSVQFTCRQLIKYKNPFLAEFFKLRKMAKDEDSAVAKELLGLDFSSLSRDVRFFYPFEVQVVDETSYRINSEGEASHTEYKKAQRIYAMNRVFKKLLLHKGLIQE